MTSSKHPVSTNGFSDVINKLQKSLITAFEPQSSDNNYMATKLSHMNILVWSHAVIQHSLQVGNMLRTSTFQSCAYMCCPVALFKVQSGVIIHALTINASGTVKKVPCYCGSASYLRDHLEWEPHFLRFSTQAHKQVFYCYLSLDSAMFIQI